MKIKIKLMLAFSVISLIVLLMGLTAVQVSQNALKKQIGESSMLLAQNALDRIDRSIYNGIEVFQVYSKDLLLHEILIKSNQEFEKLEDIQEYIDEKESEWTTSPKEEITPFMRDLMGNDASRELIELKEQYKEKYGYKVIGEIFVTNKYGVNVVQTGKTSDYYQADGEWWQKAKREGLYVDDIEYDESADIYSIALCIRVDDDEGNFLGVMKVVLNIREVFEIIKEIEHVKKHEIYGHESHESMHFKMMERDGAVIYPEAGYEFDKATFSPVMEYMLSEDAGYIVAKGYDEGVEESLYAHAHSRGYKDYNGMGWMLVVEHDIEEIFAPVHKLRQFIIILSLIVALFALLIGVSISYSISKRITILSKTAEEIGKGNYDVKPDVKTKDEIGRLSQIFVSMGWRIQEYHKGLEQKVEQRTSELKKKVDELEKFSKLIVDRELKMINLKNQIVELRKRKK